MLGVVVWSNEKRSKAVIWCEDQGALAYLEGDENLASGAVTWPVAGDLVELESDLSAGLRRAREVRLLSQGAGAALPQALREKASEAEPAQTGAVLRVLPGGIVDAPDEAEPLPERQRVAI